MDIKYLKKDGISLDNEKNIKRMRVCAMILNRLIKDDYIINVYKNHDKKWGDLNLSFDKDGYVDISRPNVITEDDKKQEEKENAKLVNKETYMKKQDLDYLFDIIKKHILKWWD